MGMDTPSTDRVMRSSRRLSEIKEKTSEVKDQEHSQHAAVQPDVTSTEREARPSWQRGRKQLSDTRDADQKRRDSPSTMNKSTDLFIEALKEAIEGPGLVWAKCGGHPFWPAKLCDEEETEQMIRHQQRGDQICVHFLGAHNFGWVFPHHVRPFSNPPDTKEPFGKRKKKKKKDKNSAKLFDEGMVEAQKLQEAKEGFRISDKDGMLRLYGPIIMKVANGVSVRKPEEEPAPAEEVVQEEARVERKATDRLRKRKRSFDGEGDRESGRRHKVDRQTRLAEQREAATATRKGKKKKEKKKKTDRKAEKRRAAAEAEREIDVESNEAAEESDAKEEELGEDDFCLVCGGTGELLLCDFPGCPKVYHQYCLIGSAPPVPDQQWICPRHICALTGEPEVVNGVSALSFGSSVAQSSRDSDDGETLSTTSAENTSRPLAGLSTTDAASAVKDAAASLYGTSVASQPDSTAQSTSGSSRAVQSTILPMPRIAASARPPPMPGHFTSNHPPPLPPPAYSTMYPQTLPGVPSAPRMMPWPPMGSQGVPLFSTSMPATTSLASNSDHSNSHQSTHAITSGMSYAATRAIPSPASAQPPGKSAAMRNNILWKCMTCPVALSERAVLKGYLESAYIPPYTNSNGGRGRGVRKRAAAFPAFIDAGLRAEIVPSFELAAIVRQNEGDQQNQPQKDGDTSQRKSERSVSVLSDSNGRHPNAVTKAFTAPAGAVSGSIKSSRRSAAMAAQATWSKVQGPSRDAVPMPVVLDSKERIFRCPLCLSPPPAVALAKHFEKAWAKAANNHLAKPFLGPFLPLTSDSESYGKVRAEGTGGRASRSNTAAGEGEYIMDLGYMLWKIRCCKYRSRVDLFQDWTMMKNQLVAKIGTTKSARALNQALQTLEMIVEADLEDDKNERLAVLERELTEVQVSSVVDMWPTRWRQECMPGVYPEPSQQKLDSQPWPWDHRGPYWSLAKRQTMVQWVQYILNPPHPPRSGAIEHLHDRIREHHASSERQTKPEKVVKEKNSVAEKLLSSTKELSSTKAGTKRKLPTSEKGSHLDSDGEEIAEFLLSLRRESELHGFKESLPLCQFNSSALDYFRSPSDVDIDSMFEQQSKILRKAVEMNGALRKAWQVSRETLVEDIDGSRSAGVLTLGEGLLNLELRTVNRRLKARLEEKESDLNRLRSEWANAQFQIISLQRQVAESLRQNQVYLEASSCISCAARSRGGKENGEHPASAVDRVGDEEQSEAHSVKGKSLRAVPTRTPSDTVSSASPILLASDGKESSTNGDSLSSGENVLADTDKRLPPRRASGRLADNRTKSE